MPQIIVENISSQKIKVVEVTLPSNKVVFDSIEQGSIHRIYYSLSQRDGVYKYLVVFEDGNEITGKCGYVTANELGKSHRFTVRGNSVVTCNG